MTTSPTGTPAGVKSAMRTLDVIEYVVARPPGVGAQEIALALGIPVSSLSYLLATLVERDYLRRDGRRYFAGKGLDRLGRPHAEYSLVDRARPLIKALRLQLNETSSLFVPVDWEMEAVLTETSGQTLRYAIEVGTRTPLHCVAAGKAVLASLTEDELDRYFAEATLDRFTEFTKCDRASLAKDLRQIRETGVGFTRDEYTLGMTGVGAAVVSGGKAIAAIGVAIPTSRSSGEMQKRMVEHVTKCVGALMTNDGEARAHSLYSRPA